MLCSLPQLFKLALRLDKNKVPRIVCQMKGLARDMPLGLILRCLGCQSDKEILDVMFENNINRTVEEAMTKRPAEFEVIKRVVELIKGSLEQVALTEDQCMLFVGRSIDSIKNVESDEHVYHYTKKFIGDRLLPHIGTKEDSNRKKIAFLGQMAKRLLMAYCGAIPEDDRDHYGRKRVDMTGQLLLSLFKDRFKNHYLQTAKTLMKKKLQGDLSGSEGHMRRFEMIFDHKTITNVLRSSLTTGNWGRGMRGEPVRVGVSQSLKRETSYFSILSNLRRVVTQLHASSRNNKPRMLHNTHFGLICPAETPEGHNIGVVKNMALMTRVSENITIADYDNIMEILRKSEHFRFYDSQTVQDFTLESTRITLNGNWVGFTLKPI